MTVLTVDVTPTTKVQGWEWGENLTVFWPVRQHDGSIRMVPIMAAGDQTMAIVPAVVQNGMAVIAPQQAALAPQLFEREVGIPGQPVLAASMAELMQRIGREAGRNRQSHIRRQLEEESQLYLHCAEVAPIFTFAAWVNPTEEGGIGAGMMFCGKPWVSYWHRTPDTAAETLLNDPWQQTSVAAELVRLAQRANEAAKYAIPCFTPYRVRAAALAEWHRLMVEADRLAQEFLADNLQSWVGKPIGFTPTAMPWMATPQGVGTHIQIGDLPIPEPHLRVGGCHIEL